MDLKTYLSNKGLSVPAFGRSVGVDNRQTMWRYVSGERMPPRDVLRRIREETDGQVTADDFVGCEIVSATLTTPAQPEGVA